MIHSTDGHSKLVRCLFVVVVASSSFLSLGHRGSNAQTAELGPVAYWKYTFPGPEAIGASQLTIGPQTPSEADVRFYGLVTAISAVPMPGAPKIWTVQVQEMLSGPPLSGLVLVKTQALLACSESTVEEGIIVGDHVVVNGNYGWNNSPDVWLCGPGDQSGSTYYIRQSSASDVTVEGQFEFEDTNSSQGYPPSQTNVRVRIRNMGTESVTGTVTLYANNVQVGSKSFPDTGQPLPPTYLTSVWVPWNLGSDSGKLENIELKAAAQIAGYTDMNPADNIYTETVSIYWANFQLTQDAYHFENQGYQAIDFWQDMRDLLPYMNPANFGQVVAHIVGYVTEWGGHCFGMSATSIIYRDHPELRPGSYSTTYAIPDSEAWPMIRKYQRNQFLVFPRRLIEGFPIGFDASREFTRSVDLLNKNIPKPAELTLTPASNRGGHSVVVYKAARTASGNILFVYDNNYPYDQVPTRARMATVNGSGLLTYTSGSNTYTHFYAHDVNPLTDDVVAEAAIKQAREWQASKDLATIFVGSPVEPVIVDAQGNRLGIVNGLEVREISGGQMWHLGSQTFFALPQEKASSIRVTALPTATVGSTMTLAYAASFGDNSLLEVSFRSVPINANQVYTTLVSTDASSVDPVHLPGGGTFPPDIVEVREHVIFEIYLPLITKSS